MKEESNGRGRKERSRQEGREEGRQGRQAGRKVGRKEGRMAPVRFWPLLFFFFLLGLLFVGFLAFVHFLASTGFLASVGFSWFCIFFLFFSCCCCCCCCCCQDTCSLPTCVWYILHHRYFVLTLAQGKKVAPGRELTSVEYFRVECC